MKLHFLLAFLMFIISGAVFADATCSKDQAKASVMKFCPMVEKDGEKAFPEITTYRYCGENYVWVQTITEKDGDPVIMKVHGLKPKLVGVNVKDNKTQLSGQFLFHDFDKKVKGKTGEGWVDYGWIKPGDEKETMKTSYVKKCGKFLVGSGIWK